MRNDDPTKPPPDAGHTYLGRYGLANPWVAWLVGRAPELAAHVQINGARGAPPRCVADRERWNGKRWVLDRDERRQRQPCDRLMLYRPGAWRCYQHPKPATVLDRPRYERAPDLDVLRRVGDGTILDGGYDEFGAYRAVVVER